MLLEQLAELLVHQPRLGIRSKAVHARKKQMWSARRVQVGQNLGPKIRRQHSFLAAGLRHCYVQSAVGQKAAGQTCAGVEHKVAKHGLGHSRHVREHVREQVRREMVPEQLYNV